MKFKRIGYTFGLIKESQNHYIVTDMNCKEQLKTFRLKVLKGIFSPLSPHPIHTHIYRERKTDEYYISFKFSLDNIQD